MDTTVLVLNVFLIIFMVLGCLGLIEAIINFKRNIEESLIAGLIFFIIFGGALLYFGLFNDFWDNPVL